GRAERTSAAAHSDRAPGTSSGTGGSISRAAGDKRAGVAAARACAHRQAPPTQPRAADVRTNGRWRPDHALTLTPFGGGPYGPAHGVAGLRGDMDRGGDRCGFIVGARGRR